MPQRAALRTAVFLAIIALGPSTGWALELAGLASGEVRRPGLAAAEGSGFFWTQEAGILNGRALELVYDADGYYQADPDYIVSKLVWPHLALPYLGNRMELRGGRGYFSELEVKVGMPTSWAWMDDYDYLEGDGKTTHYSTHRAYVERALYADLRFGKASPLGRAVETELGLGLSLKSFKWTARDGYTQYASDSGDTYWNAGLPKDAVWGTLMAYEQLHVIPSVFAGLGWELGKAWRMELGAAFSVLGYCEDLDNHLHPDKRYDYYEWMFGGIVLEPSLELKKTVQSARELVFRANYSSVFGLRGLTRQMSSPSGIYWEYPDGAGAAYSALSLGAGIRLRL